jgi:alkanesulfonate monooxygenase SsuD/methylene tetrahydromethanopterin reductase-like flavin-dependent oxidoreductase (luciferase family)
MQHGLVMRTDVEPSSLIDLAVEAEASGWDGLFIWDAFLGPHTGVLLGAIAARTRHLRFGTMLTPPSVRRPWRLAAEAATLDRLSGGRLILSFGLGAAEDLGFARVGEATDRRVRAELLDESLDILSGLWGGEPFSYTGTHSHLSDAVLTVKPVQAPRIPIWVVGAWPRPKSMRRVPRCDGLIPCVMTPDGMVNYEPTPDDLRAMAAFVAERRTLTTPFDIVIEGETPGEDREQATGIVQRWADVGATWWLECVAAGAYKRGGLGGVRTRIAQGPPRPR